MFCRRLSGFPEQQTLPLHRCWLAGSEAVRFARDIRYSCCPLPVAATRSDGRAPSSARALSQTQAPRQAFAPIPPPCLSIAQVSGTRAEARRNPPAIYLRRQKAASGPICRTRESLSEVGSSKTCAKRPTPNAQRPTPNSGGTTAGGHRAPLQQGGARSI